MDKFVDKMKVYLDKGVEVSKETLGKAGEAVQELGDKSVTKVEQLQFEKKLRQAYIELGKQCYDKLSKDDSASVVASDTEIHDAMLDVKNLIESIEACKKNFVKKK